MRRQSVPRAWNRGPVLALYAVLAIVLVAVLRFAGRGWIGAVTAGLVLAGVVSVLLVLVGSVRPRILPRGHPRHDDTERE